MDTEAISNTRLEEASKRVHRALDALEAATRNQAKPLDHQALDQQHLQLVVDENNSLKGEQKQLNEAIDMLQDQYDDLQKVATNIYGKLDDSVRRISKIIGD